MGTKRGQALYPCLMGAEWNALDARLQSFHSAAKTRRGAGRFQVRHGDRKLARVLAWLLRLPRKGQDVPAQLLVRDGGIPAGGISAAEIWKRSFGERDLISLQYANPQGLLAERFGLTELWFRLEASDHSLVFVPAGGALVLGPIRISLPLRLSPQVHARVSASREFSQRFMVSVSLVVPWIGLLLAYDGYIEPEVTNS
jgi:hypothetical protein